MMEGFGYEAALSIVVHLSFLAVTWWALQSVNIEKIIKANRVFQAKLMLILLTIAIGSGVSNFFLDYLLWAQRLPMLFR